MIHILQYGNTKTFYIANGVEGILVDTDWAGSISMFYREIKRHGILIENIKYLIITHYHPDHMGLAGQLTELGIKLVIVDIQQDFIHSSDCIFQKEKRFDYKPIVEDEALIISCEESRSFLKEIGIDGEIIHTPGHSEDSVSLILDEGIAIVGDLYPIDTVIAYNDNVLKNSWNELLSHNLKTVYYGHAKEREVLNLRTIDDL